MCFNEIRLSVLALQLFKAVPTETVCVLWLAAGEKRIGMSRIDWAAVIQPFIGLGNISRSPEANREHIALAHFHELPRPVGPISGNRQTSPSYGSS